MQVAIVKYNAGNIRSVVNALERIGVEPVLTDDPALLRNADRVVFPGQGHARTTMDYLRKKGLDQVILSLNCPVLGICIGQQLLCGHSEEGDTTCLGVFDVDVKRFQAINPQDKIPAMGWNSIETSDNPLLKNLGDKPFVYFVHSYYVPLCRHTIAGTNHILTYSAALNKDNFFATQFHPEKSGDVGEQILRNFLAL